MTAPAARAVVGRSSDGDVLMLDLHHSAFDGMSAVHLMTSIARAYSSVPDDVDAPPFATARDLDRLAGSRSIGQQLRRVRGVAGEVAKRRHPIVGVHASGGGAAPTRFGVAPLALDGKETAGLIAAKPAGTTVNDLLLAGLLLTVRRWNSDHGVPARPGVVRRGVRQLRHDVPDDLLAATTSVAQLTRTDKERRSAGWLVDLPGPGTMVPVSVKERLQRLLPLVQDSMLESTALSNLGKVGSLEFGDAGHATEVWFSPPAHAPLNVAVGVATLDGRVPHPALPHRRGRRVRGGGVRRPVPRRRHRRLSRT